MDKNEQLQVLLMEFAPDECDIIGETSIRKIIESKDKEDGIITFTSENGSNLDYALVISTVGGIVGVIDIVLKILEYRKKAKVTTRDDIVSEIINEIPSDITFSTTIGYDKEKVVKSIVYRYIKESDKT